MEERQTVTVKYSAVDESGVETVGFELRLGLMKLEDAKKTEKVLVQALGTLTSK
jgi:hypothetical protein